MQRYSILFFFSTILFASDNGCNIFQKGSVKKETKHLEIEKEHTNVTPKFLNITPKLSSVTTLHQGIQVEIKRESKKELRSCPPFCIQPMKIDGVSTVGELETLEFIEKKNKNKLRLLLDVRENENYQEATIPSAINLPLSMFDEKSPYYSKVLTLLGAKKINEKWHFKKAHTLLVFGQSFMTDEARLMIERLLELNYPADKILYYRAGMDGWNSSGLTSY
jgi:rhodanese-related sulfurtransferase